MLEEYKISKQDQNKIINYINDNNLSFIINEEGLFRFFISSMDGYMFQFYKNNEDYVVVSTDLKNTNPLESKKFNYIQYKNMQQVLEQLSFYSSQMDSNFQWWEILDGIGEPYANIQFIKEDYTDNWTNDFIKDDNWKIVDDSQYKYISFSKEMSISAISPHNRLHQTSIMYDYNPDKLDKLYFEIHPICTKEHKESYVVKILINKEEILKEWINYRIFHKKGLNLFLEELFSNKNSYIKLIK